ncbi:MAG: hypothetical protein IK073_06750 [Paludibacteraceae bacterium]|nr:hypothetical protein [Paludibacteraceae bacterium]
MKNLVKKLMFASVMISALVLTACSSGSKLEMGVAAANKQCPMELGGGMAITSIATEGSSVVYTCEVDGSAGITVSAFAMPEVQTAMKTAMVESLKSDESDTKELIEMVKEANYSLIYRFVSTDSDEKVDIVITPEEL